MILGSCSEFVQCAEEYIGLKSPSLSFEEAASIPLAATTALQALRKYHGDLAGKTVFVPAGCSKSLNIPQFDSYADDILVSGTGLFACQLAKNVFHAGKVITTVSTAKIPKLKELLGENTIDQGKTLHFHPLQLNH